MIVLLIVDTVYILLHASSLLSPLHSTNNCHYVLVFEQALYLFSCTVLKLDGRMCRFIYTKVHHLVLPCFPLHLPSDPHTVATFTV